MASNQRYNFSKVDLICPQHDGDQIQVVFLGKEYKGQSRFQCSECAEDEEKLWEKIDPSLKVKVAFKKVVGYEQLEANEEEPKLETVLPLDKTIKDNCRGLLQKYSSTEEDQIKRVSNYISQFKEEVTNHVKAVRKDALSYYEELTNLGEQLKEEYEIIIDCSQLKEIILSTQGKDELNQKLREFIHKRLESKANNDNLNQKQKFYNKTNSLYTRDCFDIMQSAILNLAQKITFDCTQQEIQSVNQFESEKNKAIKIIEKKPLRSQFNNILLSSFTFKPLSETSEMLEVTKAQEYGLAKWSTALDQSATYQFVFEIKCTDPTNESYAMIAVSNQDEVDQMKHVKYFSNKEFAGSCSFVQYGENLSQSKTNQTSTVVVLSVCLKKNQFYFTSSDRKSKNVMAQRVAFEPQIYPYYLYIHSKGQNRITLLDLEVSYK